VANPSPTSPIGPSPQELALHNAWNTLLTTLSQAINLGAIHEPDNRNMADVMARTFTQLNEAAKPQGGFHVQQHEQNIFVNNQRLRCDGATFVRHMKFLEALAERKIAGIHVKQPLTREQLNHLILSVARYKRESNTRYEDAVRQVEARGIATVVELLPIEGAGVGKRTKSVRLEKRTFAVRTYAKAMALLREYIHHLDDAAHRGYYHLKLSRVVQDLVTVCLDGSWRHIGVVHNKHFDEYLYNHSANVAMVSLVLGAATGLKRSHLQELGMAALLHDLGKAFLPPELLKKATAFTDYERKQLMQHPVLGVQALLRVPQYNEALLKRIMVICEHHEAVKGANLHFFSRVIAVAEIFDALTSDRPQRKAFLPDAAVKMMIDMAGKRLDRELVALFVRTFGLFPCGACVELNTGEVAVAVQPSPDPKMWMSPSVRIVRDPQGLPYRVPRAANLAEAPRGAEGPTRHITRAVDPASLGLNVSGFLYVETTAATGDTIIRRPP